MNLASSSNTIGGTVAGAGNTIDNNGTQRPGSGVQLVGSPIDDEILSNSIYDNAVLGINLGQGPTQNHTPGTPGPNNYQNFPTLQSAFSDGSVTTVQGTLNALPNANYLIQFFSSPSESSSKYGQGKTFIGSYIAPTNGNSLAPFECPIPSDTVPGQFISATATDPAGDTSEFAQDVQIQGQINLVVSGTASPTPVPVGGQVTYILTVSNLGNIPADNVTLTNDIPGGLTIVSATASSPGTVGPLIGSTQTANWVSIAAGGTETLKVVAQTSASTPLGSIVDTASATTSSTDPTPGNLSTTVDDKVVTSADVSVNLAANESSILAGSNLTYTVSVSNSGPQSAENVVVTLPISAAEAYVPSTSPSITYADGLVTVVFGDVGASATATAGRGRGSRRRHPQRNRDRVDRQCRTQLEQQHVQHRHHDG